MLKWILAIFALIVAASPIDLWPDLLPFGSLDDIALAVAAAQAFERDRQKRAMEGRTIVVNSDRPHDLNRDGSRPLVEIRA